MPGKIKTNQPAELLYCSVAIKFILAAPVQPIAEVWYLCQYKSSADWSVLIFSGIY